jgi:hypothetical protein
MHGLRLDGDPADALPWQLREPIKSDGHTSNSGDREDGESSGSNVLIIRPASFKAKMINSWSVNTGLPNTPFKDRRTQLPPPTLGLKI